MSYNQKDDTLLFTNNTNVCIIFYKVKTNTNQYFYNSILNSTLGSTECTPCDYLKFSSSGSSSCQDCNEGTTLKPSCFLNPRPRAQTTNLVSSSFGPSQLRSLEHEDYAGYNVGDGDSIPLNSEDKPFYVDSIVLITNISAPQVRCTIADTCVIYPRVA